MVVLGIGDICDQGGACAPVPVPVPAPVCGKDTPPLPCMVAVVGMDMADFGELRDETGEGWTDV